MTDLLTWEQGPFSSHRGTAGGIELFSIHWRTQRGDPDWTLVTVLPGTPRHLGQHDDLGKLKDLAEKTLTDWLERVSPHP